MEVFKESFNEEFCEHLEIHLSEIFKISNKKEIRQLWCDGIVCNHHSKKYINENRKLVTMAYIGQNGQDEFEMVIKFGKYVLRKYAKGREMIDCIPKSNSPNWLTIDKENKYIEIQLK